MLANGLTKTLSPKFNQRILEKHRDKLNKDELSQAKLVTIPKVRMLKQVINTLKIS